MFRMECSRKLRIGRRVDAETITEHEKSGGQEKIQSIVISLKVEKETELCLVYSTDGTSTKIDSVMVLGKLALITLGDSASDVWTSLISQSCITNLLQLDRWLNYWRTC